MAQARTGVFIIVGRVQVDGHADLAAVRELAGQFTLTSADGSAEPAGTPFRDPAVPDELRFREQLRLAVQTFPPPASEAEMLARQEPLGCCPTLLPTGTPTSS